MGQVRVGVAALTKLLFGVIALLICMPLVTALARFAIWVFDKLFVEWVF